MIRATIDAARNYFGSDYPLTNRQFLTDGRRIFLEAVEETTGAERLIDVLGRQFVFTDVIRPSLSAGIEYDHSGATRWFPTPRSRMILLDPEVQFGSPIVANAGVPTDAIYDAWKAEGRDQVRVARAYGLTPKMVSAAVAFEQRLRA